MVLAGYGEDDLGTRRYTRTRVFPSTYDRTNGARTPDNICAGTTCVAGGKHCPIELEDRLYLIGSETNSQFGGHIEGALRSVKVMLQKF